MTSGTEGVVGVADRLKVAIAAGGTAGHINPALRSRCAEIYFEPLTPKHIVQIVENAAKKLGAELPEDWKCPRCKQPKEKFNEA